MQGLKGKTFHNVEANVDIQIVQRSINKSMSAANPLLRAHYALPEILTNGSVIGTEPRSAKRPGMLGMLNIGATIMMNHKLMRVVAKVRRFPGHNQYYAMYLEQLEIFGYED